MFPNSIPHFGIGPFFGLAINLGMAMLCLVILCLYRRYHLLKWLFFFYLCSTFFFGGWLLYALQRSSDSILMGYRVCQAALVMLPAIWALFMLTLSGKKPDLQTWIIICVSLLLAIVTLLGKSVWFFGLPLETHPVYQDILRPQSKYLRLFIHIFCLIICLYYFIVLSIQLFRRKVRKPIYLLPFGMGLLLWLLGGLNDAFLARGYVFIASGKMLWFTSFGLSMFLTITVVLHFRSLEIMARQKLLDTNFELEQEIDQRKKAEAELNKYKLRLEKKVKRQTSELDQSRKALADLKGDIKRGHRFGKIIGKSEPMQAIYTLIQDLADVSATVLITGESGTGKELVAEGLHTTSRRQDKPFVKVNCAALSESILESELFGHIKGAFTGADRDKVGRFQKAKNGTILLDECGEISLYFQKRLLRVLQEREFERLGDTTTLPMNARVVAATNQDLIKKIKQGTIRQDLYYRLKVVEIKIPPLRERKEDIPLLINHFLDIFNKEQDKKIETVSPEVLRILMAYHWPGNVRELRNMLEHICILCKNTTIVEDDLPLDFPGCDLSYDQSFQALSNTPLPSSETPPGDKKALLKALEQTQWNKTRAAEILGISRRTLYRRLKEYKI